MSDKPSFFAELKRRNVYKVAVAYIVAGWALSQGIAQVFPVFDVPNWIIRSIVVLIIIGLPIALVLAWMFELTPEGIKRTDTADAMPASARPKKHVWIYVVVIGSLLSIGLFFLGRYTAPTTRVSSESSEKSIAVLPFESLSEDKANAYFADGIQDEILARLSKIADLKVISRTSTQKYKSAPANLREIAQQLGVSSVLEGTVEKAADQVRVRVQLIDAVNDSHLWAENYERKLVDLFQVESEIAQKIAGSLEAKLTGHEQQALAVKPTNNPEAYDAYLRGLAAEGQRLHSVYAMENAAAFYERAVQLDPTFAIAWARLSRIDCELYSAPNDPTATRRDAAKRALDAAQQLQPNSAETLLALGNYQLLVLRDYSAAEGTYRQASNMLPGNTDVPWALARIARGEGKWEQAIAYQEQALVLDPRNTELLVFTAESYGDFRKFEAARKLCDRALDIVPNDPNIMAAKAGFYHAEGDLREAAKLLPNVDALTPSVQIVATKIEQLWLERNHAGAITLLQARFAQFHFRSELEKGIFRTILALSQQFGGDSAGAKTSAEQARDTLAALCKTQPENNFAAFWLSRACALVGDKKSAYGEAERAKTLAQKNSSLSHAPEENLALIDAILGNHARAISILTRLLEIPYQSTYYETPVTPALLRLDPTWDPLRNDPAFQKLAASEAPKPADK